MRWLIPLAVPAVIGAILWLSGRLVLGIAPERTGEHRLDTQIGGAAIFCSVFALAAIWIGVAGLGLQRSENFWALAATGVFMGGSATYLALAAVNWRLGLDETGVQLRDEWGRTHPRLRWTEIKNVRPGWWNVRFEGSSQVLKIPFKTPCMVECVRRARSGGATVEVRLLEEVLRATGTA